MEKDIKKLVQDISQFLETKLTTFGDILTQKNFLIQSLRNHFWKNKARIPETCGILTIANKDTFAQFQILFFSAILAHNVHIAVIDEGLTPEQREWCNTQNKLTLIPKQKVYDNNWDRPFCLLASPFQMTLWLEPYCIILDNLDEAFRLIYKTPFLIEDPGKSNITDLHIAMQTNLVPHHSGPPILKGALFGYHLKRDHELLQKWVNAVEKSQNKAILTSARDVWRVLQWVIEINNQLELVTSEPKWINSPDLPKTTPLDFLETLPNEPNLLSTPYDTSDWGLLPLNIDTQDFPEISGNKSFHELCHIFILGETSIHQACFEQIPLTDDPILKEASIYQDPRLKEAKSPYVGILPADLNQRIKKTKFRLENMEDLELQLAPHKVLAPMISSDQWSNVSERRSPGMEEILEDLRQRYYLTLERPTVVGNNFICHQTVFLKLLDFWQDVYSYLLTRYNNDFNQIKPDFVYMHIPMIFFANSQDLQMSLIMDHQIRVTKSPLPYQVCQFNGITDAAFRDLKHAENYCEHNGYRYTRS